MLATLTAPGEEASIKLVLAETQHFFINGFTSFLQQFSKLHIAGLARDGEQLVQLAEQEKPVIVFTDINLPKKNGIEATREIISKHPNVKVIALTSSYDDEYITNMMAAGAIGYILKNDDPELILEAIEKALRGELCYSPAVANRLVQLAQQANNHAAATAQMVQLTIAETDVLKAFCTVYTNKAIAAALDMNPGAVRAAKSRIARKAGCRHAVEMVFHAIRIKLVKP